MSIPTRDDGKKFTIDGLYADQKQVLAVVMSTLHEFMTSDDLSTFKPLRIIVNGQGGSGKSVVINTIVAYIRSMFDCNDVVKVIAPTGVSAHNVNGETFHHFFNVAVRKRDYTPNAMSANARKRLIKKCKLLLALVIDERSLVTSKVLGSAEALLSETIFEGGHHRDESWGGLPILIIAGDDYQLPGIGEGPLTALYARGGTKMTQNGRSALLEASRFVMELGGSKRLGADATESRQLMNRLRVGEDVRDEDVNKLLSLHLDNIRLVHGDAVVNDIEDRAMYLFFRNAKRQQHNLKQLVRRSSPSNPVAIIKARSTGTTRAKGFKSHFESDAPSASLISKGCKVALNNRNYLPAWGLHNGACGTVEEIVFRRGENPNFGHMPLYVVVEFPLYCGPVWDKANPKVSGERRNQHYLASINHRAACPYTDGGIYLHSGLLSTYFLPPDSCLCTHHS